MQVAESFLLFVDSSRSSQPTSRGDDFKLSLSEDVIEAGKGQFIRLNLIDFSMYKNWYDINEYNKSGIIEHSSGTKTPFSLEEGNVSSLKEIADKFATAINGVGPITSATATVTNGILNVSVSASSGFTVRLNSDLYLLLGGTWSQTEDSLNVNAGFTNVTGKFPMQRTSSAYVYLRSDLSNNNIESIGFADDIRVPKNDISHSDVIARIPLDSEILYLEPSHDRCYFINLRQKNLSHLRLFLTDNRGRPLPQYTDQSKDGNLSFTSTLRVDIVQGRAVNEFVTKPYEPNVPARFTSNLLKKIGDISPGS